VIAVLRLDRDAPPDRKARLMDLGVDSLMAVELRGSLSSSLKLDKKLPATLIFDYPSIEEITDYLLEDVLTFTQDEPSKASSQAGQDLPTTSTDFDTLSEAAVEEMLLEKLKKLK
jgi:acyl carrier protein